MDDKKEIFELLNNNTFNLQILNETLLEIKGNSYKTLYDAQKHLTDIHRFDIPMDDYIDKKSEIIYNINYNFIDDSRRKQFRESRFYKNLISPEDIANNPADHEYDIVTSNGVKKTVTKLGIFTNMLLLFINGQMYTNFFVRADEDNLQLVFKIDSPPKIYKVTNRLSRSVGTGFSRAEFEKLVYGYDKIEFYKTNKKYSKDDVVKISTENGIEYYKCSSNGIITGKFNEYVWDRIIPSSKMTLISIPNCASLYSNPNSLLFEKDNIKTQFTLYGRGNIGLNSERFIRFNDVINNKRDAHIFMTVDDTALYKYELIGDGRIQQLSTQTENDVSHCLFFDNQTTHYYYYINNITDYNNHTALTRTYFTLNRLMKMRISSNLNFFSIPIKEMPIPIENIMIFTDDYGRLLFNHDVKLEKYYPNIYKIKRSVNEPRRPLWVYIYYSDDTVSIGNKHENELKLYHRFTENILYKYTNDSIPDTIKNYKPIYVNYSISNYQGSEYYDNNDHLSYKLNYFKELISQNGDFYRIYLDKLVGYVSAFDIYATDIENSDYGFDKRIKTHNRDEIKSTSLQKDFNEDRYLFTFRNDGDRINTILFLDNKLYYPDEIYSDDEYTYIYIPANLINIDTDPSVLHVENYQDVSFNKKINYIRPDEYIHINIPEELKLSINDLFITQNVDGIEKYITNSENNTKYKIYVKNTDSDEYILADETSFFRYTDIYIKFEEDATLQNSDIFIKANKTTIMDRNVGDNSFIINQPIDNDEKNILVFKNGQLVPPSTVVVDFNENIDGPHTVRTLMRTDNDDEFVLLYTPNKYTNVLELDSIPSTGIVNLEGRITKPIDLKWHDIYINGEKLTEKNIDMLTPYSFILKDMDTLKYLTIYEKNLDSDILAPEYDYDNINNTILDPNNDYIELPDAEIIDNSKDIRDDITIDIIGCLDKYLLSMNLINPDKQQITDEMISEYPSLFLSDDYNIFINPDLSVHNFAKDMLLNPDA